MVQLKVDAFPRDGCCFQKVMVMRSVDDEICGNPHSLLVETDEIASLKSWIKKRKWTMSIGRQTSPFVSSLQVHP
jgi:hypothetical protein